MYVLIYLFDICINRVGLLAYYNSFIPIENQLLDEESFVCALKEEQGRATNMSLFDEIRLSFCLPRQNASEINENEFDNCIDNFENSYYTVGTQTGEGFNENDEFKSECDESLKPQTQIVDKLTRGIQTEDYACDCKKQNNFTQPNLKPQTGIVDKLIRGIQTEDYICDFKMQNNFTQPELATAETPTETNNNIKSIKCLQCEKLSNYTAKLECDLRLSQTTVKDLKQELEAYEKNLNLLDKFIDEGNNTNNYLHVVLQSLQSKLGILEAVITEQTDRLDVLNNDKCVAECQTESGNFSYVL